VNATLMGLSTRPVNGVGGEDAGDWRIELKSLEPNLDEPGLGEQVVEFAGGSGGGVSGGTGTAGLCGERDAPSGPQQAP